MEDRRDLRGLRKGEWSPQLKEWEGGNLNPVELQSPEKKSGISKINKCQQVLGRQGKKEQQTWICHEYIVSKKTNSFQNWVTEFTGKMEAVGNMSADFINSFMRSCVTISQGC